MKINYLDPLKLLATWDPFTACVWDIKKPVTEREIRKLVLKGEWVPPGRLNNDCSRINHMRRIAWFVINGWSDPIDLDVGIPVLGFWVGWGITDGNHRYVASIVRGDRSIPVSCSGQVSEWKQYLSRARKAC